MRLKHVPLLENAVEVTFHKPELTRLAKAQKLLKDVSALPCAEREKASEMVQALEALAISTNGAEAWTTIKAAVSGDGDGADGGAESRDLPGQLKLPIVDGNK